MTSAANRLRALRASRRRTVRALSAIRGDQVLAHVGPARNANVRESPVATNSIRVGQALDLAAR